MRAAVYVRVSTKDQALDGWGLDDQRRQGRQQIDGRQDWTYVRTYDDGGRHGDREEQHELERLLADAASGEIDVVVTKAMDRLGRNDGEIAATLELLHDAGVRVFVAGRELDFDSPEGNLHTGIERLFADYERRKIRARTKAGLRERKRSGAPVGPIPLGYVHEEYLSDGKTKTRRVIDPVSSGTIKDIFNQVESGKTFGDVARDLNAKGVRGKRGKPWVSRTVRTIVNNRAYAGEKGYREIIDPERFEKILANLARMDPVHVAKRQGGRKAEDSYVLRGIARCTRCGASLYTRRQRGRRVYVCANRRQGTGLCHAAVIPAELIESHVIRHLDSFVGSVEDWIADRVADRDSERQTREAALDRFRAQLKALDRQQQRHMAVYRRLVDEGEPTARIALKEVDRIDRERDQQHRLIKEAEAIVSEWSGPPDVDAALDYYSRLVDQVNGRIQNADTARELNDALGTVVAGLWAEVEIDRDRLLVEFELVGGPKSVLPDGQPILFDHRSTLPPRCLNDRIEPEPLSQTETFTKVNRCLAEGRARLREAAR